MDAAKLRKDYYLSPQLGTYYYQFNQTKPPFNDVRVRKAWPMVRPESWRRSGPSATPFASASAAARPTSGAAKGGSPSGKSPIS